MRDDDGEDQQHAGEGEEGEEGVVIGDVIGRAEGRLAGRCDDEGEEGEESEGKSDGGKWRTREGGEEKEEPLTLDLTVTSPGEQPSPNPGEIFSYASSSTLYPCERVSRWAEFRIAASSVAWSLRACYSVNIAL